MLSCRLFLVWVLYFVFLWKREMSATLVVLAAGIGSRYGGLKQVDDFWPHGETILEYSIYDAMRAGFNHIVCVIRPEIEEIFEEKIAKKLRTHISLTCVYQEKTSFIPEWFSIDHREKPWGTGHAVLVTKDVVKGPFAVINADDYYGVEWFGKIYECLQHIEPTTCCMVGYTLKNTLSAHGTVNRGVCEINEQWNLESVVERHKLERRDDGNVRDLHDRMVDETEVVSMNFRWFHESFFEGLGTLFSNFLQERGSDSTYEFYIPLAVNDFIHKGNSCKVLPCDAQRCGVTNAEDKARTQEVLGELVESGVYPSPLFA